MSPNKYIVGLTGGIGSGKSTAADIFTRLGVEVIDADAIARQLVARGSPALAAIVQHFGPDVLSAEGELDRAGLRQQIFAEPAQRQWLENLLHPRVREEIQRRVAAADSGYVVLEVPLLLESGQYSEVDRVLVVDVPVEQQISRASRRDSSRREEIERIIAAQIPRAERLRRADDILDNRVSKQELAREVKKLHEFYRKQAQQHHQAG